MYAGWENTDGFPAIIIRWYIVYREMVLKEEERGEMYVMIILSPPHSQQRRISVGILYVQCEKEEEKNRKEEKGKEKERKRRNKGITLADRVTYMLQEQK